MCIVEKNSLVQRYRDEAKERQLSGRGIDGSGGRGNKKNLTQTIGEGNKHANESTQRIAQEVGTNRQYVADAQTIIEKSPALAQEVKEGKKSIPQAKRELKVMLVKQLTNILTNMQGAPRIDKDSKEARNKKIFALWLACYT